VRSEEGTPAPGTVYLIGAGPGDPGLLTIKGRRCIRDADVVVYDYLANPALLSEAKAEAEITYVGKRGSDHTAEQAQINELLVAKAREGKTVARLKGGDAFIFGRGGEEALFLAEHDIPFEIVPGVTSAYAVPAYAGIPVTHRGLASDVAFITGHEQRADGTPDIAWEMAAKSTGTLVFLMGVKNLPLIVDRLVANGKPAGTPVAVVRWGTLADQETLTGTLGDITEKVRGRDFHPPAVIVVGDVVRLREKLAWFEKKPLFGRRVIVTRAAGQVGSLGRALEEAGAEIIDFPTIAIEPIDDTAPIDGALADMAAGKPFEWTIFTSANGVDFFFANARRAGYDARILGGSRIAVVGTATAAALADFGLTPDLVPSDFRAEGLVDEFRRLDVADKRILLPRAKEGREILPAALREIGAEVVVAPVYRNVPAKPPVEPVKEALAAGRVGFTTFTSGSTVKNFVSLLGADGDLPELMSKTRIAVIGPVTAKSAAKCGLTVDVMPEVSTIPALVEAIKEWVTGDGGRGTKSE